MHHYRTDHARFVRQSRLVGVGPEAGVREADNFVSFAGQDHALAIKIGLREVERLERVDADAGCSAAAERGAVPQGGESRRIAIGERPILDHSTPTGQRGRCPAGCSKAISFSAAIDKYELMAEGP